jgi:hypothetical protein
MVAGDVRRLLGSSSGDLTLRTTLNLELQRLAEGVIARRLEAEGAKKNVSQASLVALGKDGAFWRWLVVGITKPVSSIAPRKQSGRRDRCSSFSFT